MFVPVAQLGSPRLLALSLENGALRWEAVLTRQSGSEVFGSPTYWNGTAYIGTSGPSQDQSTARGSVVALDEATGKLRWQTYTVPPGHDGGAVWSTAAIDTATGRMYVGTGNAYHPPAADTTDAVMALDAATGQVLGHYQASSGDTFDAQDNPVGADSDFGASPNLIVGPDGRSLIGEGAKSGVYWALDRATLQPVWNTMVGPGSAAGGILGSTAYDGVRVYGSDALNGHIWALGKNGSPQWTSQDTGPLDFSPVAIANGVLYSSDPSGSLTARDPSTGTVLNKLSLGGATFGGMSAAGSAIYAAVGTGPPPAPAPQQDGSGSIIAFGDTSRSGASGAQSPPGQSGHSQPGGRSGSGRHTAKRRHPRMRLSVRPSPARAGHRVVFRFHVTLGGRPLAGAVIRLGRHRARTGRNGNASIAARLGPGIHRARASKRGLRSARATVLAVALDRT